jgi:hypothetical protein
LVWIQTCLIWTHELFLFAFFVAVFFVGFALEFAVFTASTNFAILFDDNGAADVVGISVVVARTVLFGNAFAVHFHHAFGTEAAFDALTFVAVTVGLIADIFAGLFARFSTRLVAFTTLAHDGASMLVSPFDGESVLSAISRKSGQRCAQTLAVTTLVAAAGVVKTIVVIFVNIGAQRVDAILEDAGGVADDAARFHGPLVTLVIQSAQVVCIVWRGLIGGGNRARIFTGDPRYAKLDWIIVLHGAVTPIVIFQIVKVATKSFHQAFVLRFQINEKTRASIPHNSDSKLVTRQLCEQKQFL